LGAELKQRIQGRSYIRSKIKTSVLGNAIPVLGVNFESKTGVTYNGDFSTKIYVQPHQ